MAIILLLLLLLFYTYKFLVDVNKIIKLYEHFLVKACADKEYFISYHSLAFIFQVDRLNLFGRMVH